MRLQGKIAVITGASMGIGEAIAQLFLKEGATVVLSSRDLGRCEQARVRLGFPEQTLAVACDVTRRSDLQRLLQVTLERYGRVDIWVNNAGFGLMDAVATMDMAECRRMFDTNVFGAIEGMQVVAPVMKRQGSGAIINISSMAGHIAVPYMAAYGATKHALNCITRAARLELAKSGVQVNNVCPGYIATDFAANAVKGSERQRMGAAARRGVPAERAARAVLNAYLKNKREVVVPARDWLVVWAYRFMPSLINFGMMRMMRPADEVIREADAARRG